jgi:hypothetical protein
MVAIAPEDPRYRDECASTRFFDAERVELPWRESAKGPGVGWRKELPDRRINGIGERVTQTGPLRDSFGGGDALPEGGGECRLVNVARRSDT